MSVRTRRALGPVAAVALLAGLVTAALAGALRAAPPLQAQATTTTRGVIETCVQLGDAFLCVNREPPNTSAPPPPDDGDGDGDDGGDGSEGGDEEVEPGDFDPGPGEDTSPCPLPPVEPPAGAPAALTIPAEVTLGSGEAAALPVHLDLPPRATPVDVFFLIDTSGSMGEVIDSLKRSVNRTGEELHAAGIDAWVGLAEFSDRTLRPYRRLVDVGPLDCRMERALSRVRLGGGDESHLLALHQSVAGTGWPAVANGSEPGRPVRPGTNATFRPGALRIVVHATDEQVRGDVAVSPSQAQAANAFKAAAAKHLGIHVVGSGTVDVGLDPTATRQSIDSFSRASGSLAPAGGIDCDGDGTADLAAGAPLTCQFGQFQPVTFGESNLPSLGRITAQVVTALRGTTDVVLRVAGGDAAGLGAVVGTASRPLDLAVPNAVDDTLSIRCPSVLRLGAAPVRTVAVEAVIGGKVVARGTTAVQCVAPGVTPRARGPLALIPPPPAPPPPAPVPAPVPAPAAAAAVASAPAPAPVVGLAVAPESQPQLAFQQSGGGDDGDVDDLARSLGAAAMTAGAAVYARRRQAARAAARQRR